MARILSYSHYFQPLADGEIPPILDERLNAVCTEKFRRIDRFIQMALMGSGECAKGRGLGPRCGLFLGSGAGQVSNNIIVQETLFRSGLLPKPFHFVNTLGSAAGYYVARNLGLTGQNLFISRDLRTFESCLELALGDFESGVLDQALIGVVEECPQPLAHQRSRLFQAPGSPLAEGSHWVLISNEAAEGGLSASLTRFRRLSELQACLREGDLIYSSLPGLGGQALPPLSAFHKSPGGAQATAFLSSGNKKALHLVQGSEDSGWTLIRLGR